MDHGQIKRYRITGGHCRKCAQQSDCLPDTQKHRARFVYRSPHQSEIDKVRKRQQTQAFIAKMIHRKWAIEGLFAEAKQFHGMHRAHYRGLTNVSIQALMTALAQNIKRVVNIYSFFVQLLRPKPIYPDYLKLLYGINQYLMPGRAFTEIY